MDNREIEFEVNKARSQSECFMDLANLMAAWANAIKHSPITSIAISLQIAGKKEELERIDASTYGEGES